MIDQVGMGMRRKCRAYVILCLSFGAAEARRAIAAGLHESSRDERGCRFGKWQNGRDPKLQWIGIVIPRGIADARRTSSAAAVRALDWGEMESVFLTTTTMRFRHRAPQPPLDRFIESLWVYQNDPRPNELERVLPTGAAQLVVNLKENETRLYDPESPYRCVSTAGSVLVGVRSRYQVIDTSEQEYVAGVAFRPGGTVPFMSIPAHEASDVDVPLEALWGHHRTALLRERMLEAESLDAKLDALEIALREMWTPPGLHPAVSFALAVFDRAPLTTTIGAVTDAIGMSAKRFIERFKAQVGVTPKRFCRIRRFQRAVGQAHRGHHIDWARVALECGYFDQAHFIHDFRSFSGLTPTGYQAARTQYQNHVKFLQSDAADL